MTVTVKHPFVSTVPDSADTSLVRPSNWNADHTVLGLGTAAELNAGVALGVATLDASGKVPISEIPDAVIGALNYQGTWNASTNTPTLISSVGVKGYYYVVNVAGTTNLNGITDWQIGDWAVFDGLIWEKIDNTDGVTSVNGLTGAVVLTTTNIAEGTNEYFTTSRARTSISAGTGISYDNSTGVITNTAPSLGGDVVGPASATDNAIARFDTTTGKLIQNSVVTVSDTGVIAGAPSISNINFVDFDTTYATTLTEGQLGWDGNNTLALGMYGGNVIQHIGEDSYFYIKASSAITKGQLIMFTGAVGASGVLTGAPSTGVTNPQYIMGVAAESIALNGFGLVQWFGELTNVNTNSFNEGDILYYDSAVTGGLTNVYPTSGIIVQVAAVAKKSAGGGVIYIRVSVTQRLTAGTAISVSQNGTGTSITNTGVTSAVAGTGISVSGATGAVTITNIAPDQTVAITAGTGISVSGTYPSFTIANSGVTSLTGTASQVTVSASTGAITLSLPSTINVNTSGNAATVTNGVYTTGSYADPTWITSLAGSKITGTIDGGTF